MHFYFEKVPTTYLPVFVYYYMSLLLLQYRNSLSQLPLSMVEIIKAPYKINT